MRSCLTLFKKREVFFPFCVFVLTLLLYLPQVFLCEAILCDAALRCVPMVECFFHQSFSAFHSGVFLSLLTAKNFQKINGGKLSEICRSEKSNSISGS